MCPACDDSQLVLGEPCWLCHGGEPCEPTGATAAYLVAAIATATTVAILLLM